MIDLMPFIDQFVQCFKQCWAFIIIVPAVSEMWVCSLTFTFRTLIRCFETLKQSAKMKHPSMLHQNQIPIAVWSLVRIFAL